MEFLRKIPDQVIVALPSKGRLRDVVVQYLHSFGLQVTSGTTRSLQGRIEGFDAAKVVFLHAKDIPVLLAKRTIDLGFTGLDLIHETASAIRPVKRLGVGKVKMGILVPENSPISHPFELMGKTIGTSFHRLAKQYFDQLKIPVHIQPILGASEGLPYLGLVDAIVDVIETGKSAIENKLKIIDDSIFDSECVLCVHTPEMYENYRVVNSFLQRLY